MWLYKKNLRLLADSFAFKQYYWKLSIHSTKQLFCGKNNNRGVAKILGNGGDSIEKYLRKQNKISIQLKINYHSNAR